MLFKEIITVNSLERQPVIKRGPVLIRNVNKLLRTKKKKISSAKEYPRILSHRIFFMIISIRISKRFVSIYQNCLDVMFRSFLLFGKKKAMIIYIEGLSDIEGIENFVLIPFMKETGNETKPLNELLEKRSLFRKQKN